MVGGVLLELAVHNKIRHRVADARFALTLGCQPAAERNDRTPARLSYPGGAVAGNEGLGWCPYEHPSGLALRGTGGQASLPVLPERACGLAGLAPVHGFLFAALASTSFQNSAAGLPLIVSSVLMERRISASRSGLKSHRRS